MVCGLARPCALCVRACVCVCACVRVCVRARTPRPRYLFTADKIFCLKANHTTNITDQSKKLIYLVHFEMRLTQ